MCNDKRLSLKKIWYELKIIFKKRKMISEKRAYNKLTHVEYKVK